MLFNLRRTAKTGPPFFFVRAGASDRGYDSQMFAPFYTLYALIVAIAIVVWIVIRRLQ